MVFAIMEIWKASIEKRDYCGNIATSMKEARQKNATKTKATKFKIIKAVVAKTKKRNTEKSSKAILMIKPASRKIKNSTISLKSETKNKTSGDDYQSKFILSTQINAKILLKFFLSIRLMRCQMLYMNLDNLLTLRKPFQITACF